MSNHYYRRSSTGVTLMRLETTVNINTTHHGKHFVKFYGTFTTSTWESRYPERQLQQETANTYIFLHYNQRRICVSPNHTSKKRQLLSAFSPLQPRRKLVKFLKFQLSHIYKLNLFYNIYIVLHYVFTSILCILIVKYCPF